jgi:O-antigen ligase
VSAVLEADLDVLAPAAPRPATSVRLLLLLLAVTGSAVVLAVGFPRGAADRLPVLLLSLALALDAVIRPTAAIRDFCFAFPVAGFFASLFGATDPVAWPVLLVGGLAVGWTFRFLYDFESLPDTSRLDSPLRSLVAIWTLGAVVAVANAKTWWALVHRLTGRTVNGQGLPEAAAVRETVLTLAILGAGAAFFFLLRRSGERARAGATRAALIGTALSAFLAVLQAAGLGPAEARPFWKLTGRLSGGATDPNALGILCGLAIPVLVAFALRRDRPGWALPALLPLLLGLALSGSRSGFLMAVFGGAAVIALAPVGRRLRAGVALVAIATLVVLLGTALVRGSPGDVGERLGQLFRSSLSLEDRASSRPILWRAALQLFTESPVVGGGLGSFSWRLPDLAGVDRDRLALRDNPGSAYLQALAETGIVGLFLTLVFVVSLGRQALSRARDPVSSGASTAVLAFLLVLVVGSHWLAPEAGFLFFLLCAVVASRGERSRQTGARLRLLLVALFAILAARAVFATADPAVTFRHANRIGFFDREIGTGGAFRWTRRRFALRVGRDAPERILLANYSRDGKPVEVTLRADEGSVLFRRTLAPGGATRLALWAGGRPRVFRFELSRSFVPKRLGLSDRRELGVVAVLPEDERF